MRIAQVAPLFESVPPKAYGGTERVVSYLTEELVSQGHDVTLFASGDSVTRARLRAVRPKSIRVDKNCIDHLASHMLMLERVFQFAHEFDVIHFHTDVLHYPMLRRLRTPAVTTLHGRLDLPELIPLHNEFDDVPIVSISDAQRRPLTQVQWAATVYHGLPLSLYELNESPEDYLAFLGRVSPEKRVDRAIKIALRSGLPLKIAAKIDPTDRAYFQEEIEPLLDSPDVEFIGEIGEREKREFLRNARALLFPIDWPEPFGLVMIEAMACGTPVIAYPNGSVAEVIDHGRNGFLVENVEQAVRAVGRLDKISRRRCRDIFEDRFSAPRMAADYLRVYSQLIEERRPGITRVVIPEVVAGEAV